MATIETIVKYKTDLNNRTKGERMLPENTTYQEALNEAIEGEFQVIIQTLPFRNNPGHYYLKAKKINMNYDAVRLCLEINREEGKFERRNCWLIKYE